MGCKKVKISEFVTIEQAQDFKAIFGEDSVDREAFKEKVCKELEKVSSAKKELEKREKRLKNMLLPFMEESETIGNVSKIASTRKTVTDEAVNWLKRHRYYSSVVEEKVSMKKLNPIIKENEDLGKLMDTSTSAYIKVK